MRSGFFAESYLCGRPDFHWPLVIARKTNQTAAGAAIAKGPQKLRCGSKQVAGKASLLGTLPSRAELGEQMKHDGLT